MAFATWLEKQATSIHASYININAFCGRNSQGLPDASVKKPSFEMYIRSIMLIWMNQPPAFATDAVAMALAARDILKVLPKTHPIYPAFADAEPILKRRFTNLSEAFRDKAYVLDNEEMKMLRRQGAEVKWYEKREQDPGWRKNDFNCVLEDWAKDSFRHQECWSPSSIPYDDADSRNLLPVACFWPQFK